MRPDTSPAVDRPRRPAEFREALAQTQRFTQSRIERILSVVVGAGSAVIGVQAVSNAFAFDAADPVWHTIILVAVAVALAVMCLGLVTSFQARWAAGTFAVVYPAALLLWPLAVGGSMESAAQPWTWYLVNVGTVAAIFAFALPLQAVWCFLVPVVYAAVRFALIGPDYLVGIVLDAIFAVILATVLLMVAWILRSVAARIDEAREGAVRSYAQAAAADATEKERVAVAALMHDSVLAALIAAERAESERERTLAVTMARDALTRLANVDQDAGEGPDAPHAATTIAAELEAAAIRLYPGVETSARIAPDARAVPGRVARALHLAAVQAIANSVEHARGAGLRVECDVDETGIVISVTDRGPGFAADRIPDDRLGIRASIIARVNAVAGTATVDSTAEGTRVVLEWRERP